MGSFWQDAWTSFKAVFGPVLAGAAFVLALLGPIYAPSATVQISAIWLAVAILVMLVVLLTECDLLATARRQARRRLPRVVHVDAATPSNNSPGRPVTLVLEPSELFGVNIIVTIYYVERLEQPRDEAFERSIGMGGWSMFSRTASSRSWC